MRTAAKPAIKPVAEALPDPSEVENPSDSLEMLIRCVVDAGARLTRLHDAVLTYRDNMTAYQSIMGELPEGGRARALPVLTQTLGADTGRQYRHELKRLDHDSALHVLVPLLRLNLQVLHEELDEINGCMADAKPIVDDLIAQVQNTGAA